MKDPETAAEWQEAVNLAEALILIDSAKQYGLVHGGPAINVERCAAIRQQGRERGVLPTKAGVDAVIANFAGGR